MARSFGMARRRNAKSTVSRLPKTCTIFSRRKPAGNRTEREILRQQNEFVLPAWWMTVQQFFPVFLLAFRITDASKFVNCIA